MNELARIPRVVKVHQGRRYAARLRDLDVRNFTRPGDFPDGANLFLHVGSTGSKSWLFKYQRRGQRHELGLGPVASISLAEARRKAQDARDLLARDVDPLAARKTAHAAAQGQAITFGQVADQVFALKRPELRATTAAAWVATFAMRHCRELREKPVALIDTADILTILEPFSPVMMQQWRPRLEAALDFAKAKGWREGENPARWRGHLALQLPHRGTITHHPALAYEAMPAFVQGLRANETMAARCLEFLILTVARSGEARGPLWTELDLEAAVWTLPPERVKQGRQHRVPLSSRAMALLAELAAVRTGPLVFPNRNGHRFEAYNLQRLMPEGASVHGCRSSFRDWAGDNETGPLPWQLRIERETAEGCLAHVIGNQVERSYRRGDDLKARRVALDAWAAYLDTAP
jgi:integrase